VTTSAEELLGRIKVNGDVPQHVAVIMDGTGGGPRSGTSPSRRAPGRDDRGAGMRRRLPPGGVEVLTLFAFSQENWHRPPEEIEALMTLLQEYVSKEGSELRERGAAVRMLGNLERLTPAARAAVDTIESQTSGGTALSLNICLSYGSRAEITRAARLLAEEVAAGRMTPAEVDEAAMTARLYTAGCPDPDLLIRTSGEHRLSNFLLWQVAYAEFHVTSVLWPDFTRRHLFEAILDFQRRDRRFGRVPASS
jgi:undecaprenyl diphosphate synthase